MNLPTIKEIQSGELTLTGKENILNVLLNQEPPKEWIKKHPIAGTNYLPIDKIEFLLTKIFIKWNVEIKNVQVIANSAVVTVRLFYLNPISEQMEWQDGIGAAPIHTNKGKGAMDWNEVQADSVMKAVPSAKSFAVKDAAEELGKIFGKDLNRKDTMAYESLLKDEERFKDAKLIEK